MHRMKAITVLLLALMLVSSSLCFAAPNMIGVSTYSAGSKGYSIVAGLATVIESATGIKVRAMPTGTNMARVKTVTKGQTFMGALYENGLYPAQGGFWDYLKDGPQDLALAWMGYIGNGNIITTDKSGIKTWDDLKGKRVASYEDYDPGTAMLFEAMLAWGNITYDDVRSLPATYSSGLDYLKAGKLDAAEGTASAGMVYELGAGMEGVYLFNFDPSDKEAIKRFKKICPVAGPGKMPVGYGFTQEKPGNVIVYPGFFITKPDNDADTMYKIVKSISEGYAGYKDAHPEAKYWSLESALNMDYLNLSGIPYHEGAIKYFREIGRWTDRHEKWQQSRLAFKEQVKTGYAAALKEAKSQNIEAGSKEFEKFWYPRFLKMRSDLALNEF